ncbi:hypothetical protein WISP_107337 [Willisornis vidua]|uniref:Uncharacterized protein n=1 Tax=Willisornis vidua TaxID=1566151 RepID=A0ABQ9CWH0_9PASS|nr:hypothetical protein WISP_107337 [Willisornis vidua]
MEVIFEDRSYESEICRIRKSNLACGGDSRKPPRIKCMCSLGDEPELCGYGTPFTPKEKEGFDQKQRLPENLHLEVLALFISLILARSEKRVK